MDSRSFILFTVLAVFSVLQGSDALRCYQCTSRGLTHNSPNSQCADPMDSRMYPQDCTTNAVRELNKFLTDLSPSTTKIIDDVLGVQYQAAHFENSVQCQKLDLLIDNRYNYTIRSCVNVAETPDEHCRRIMALNNDNVRTTYCGTCTADGCNGASGLVGSLLLSVALPAALVAFLASSWSRA